MTYYPTTPLLPYYPTGSLHYVDEIIVSLWTKHLELEWLSPPNSISVVQHLDMTAAIIEFWEEQLIEINKHEIQQRRLNNCKHG